MIVCDRLAVTGVQVYVKYAVTEDMKVSYVMA